MKTTPDHFSVRLQQARPPRVEAPLLQEELKQKLLARCLPESGRPWTAQPILWLGSLAGAVLVALAALLILQIVPPRVSAQERLRGLEARYRKAHSADRTRYTKASVTFAASGGQPLLAETWAFADRLFRVRMSRQGKTLGQALWVEGVLFEMPDPKPVELRLCAPRPGETPGADRSPRKVLLLPLPDVQKPTDGFRQVNVVVIRGAIASAQFAAQSPLDIFARLRNDPATEYLGRFKEPQSQRTLECFRRSASTDLISAVVAFDPNAPEALHQFVNQAVEGFSFPNPTVSAGSSLRLVSPPTGITPGAEPPKAEERVSIDRASGRIVNFSVSLSWQGRPLDCYAMTILEDATGDYRPADFDPTGLGLTAAP